MTAATFVVNGHKIRTATRRRYVVITSYTWPPAILKRSDNLDTARREAARWRQAAVYDTRSGALA